MLKSKIVAILCVVMLVGACALHQIICNPTDAQKEQAANVYNWIITALNTTNHPEAVALLTFALPVIKKIRDAGCTFIDDITQAVEAVEKAEVLIQEEQAKQAVVYRAKQLSSLPDMSALKTVKR